MHIAQRSGGTGHGILLTTLLKWKILTHENNLITSYCTTEVPNFAAESLFLVEFSISIKIKHLWVADTKLLQSDMPEI